MRFLQALKNDIRFQMKYGFYLLYAFFCVVYIAALKITPPEYKKTVASLILLTDPAMLGVFFIGGIWLLEKGEGLHRYWSVSPLRPLEYILSKSLSLAILSTITADLILLLGVGSRGRFAVLSCGVFLGSAVFNLMGLMVASYARSVNHYMILVILPMMLLSIPPVLTAFGLAHPLFEIFPGTALWHLIAGALDMTQDIQGLLWINLTLWFGFSFVLSNKRIAAALQEGGEAHEAHHDPI